MPDFPCHSRPREKWCDHSGPGGFMGHTCQISAGIHDREIKQRNELRRLEAERAALDRRIGTLRDELGCGY